MSGAEPTLQLRALLSGRDFAAGDPLAREMRNLCYVVVDSSSRRALLVDPAYRPDELLDLVVAEGFELEGVVVTHHHSDHCGGLLFGSHSIAGVSELLELSSLPVHVHAAEKATMTSKGEGVEAALVTHEDGDRIALGSLELEVLHTPGHTEGSQCLAVAGHLLTGDTLFLTGCGRTDLPGGDAGALYESLTRLAGLPGDPLVCPGHFYDTTPAAPLSEVCRHNPVFRPRSKEEWLGYFA